MIASQKNLDLGSGVIKENEMKFLNILLLAILALSLSCARSTYSFNDKNDKPVAIEQTFYGRGSLAFEVDKEGDPHLVVCQDGTSDWILGRLFVVLGNLASKMLAPVPILGEAVKMQAPSDVQACSALYDKVREADD